MLTQTELYRNALRIVQSKRQDAKLAAETRRTEILSSNHEIKQAEEKLRKAAISAAILAADGTDSDKSKALLKAASAELASTLNKYGLPEDYLEPSYHCSLCEDTGKLDGKTCKCVIRIMQGLRQKEIVSATALKLQSFETLSTRYYPQTVDPITGKDTREYMVKLLASLEEYGETFDQNSANLMLVGNAGLGKTHVALSIADCALKRGYDAIYISSPELFSKLEDIHFSGDSAEENSLCTAVSETDLFVLDDLGTEMVSSYMLSVFYRILNARISQQKPTIITSNIKDDSVLEKRYTEKIASRLIGNFEQFVFIGTDIRLLKANETEI